MRVASLSVKLLVSLCREVLQTVADATVVVFFFALCYCNLARVGEWCLSTGPTYCESTSCLPYRWAHCSIHHARSQAKNLYDATCVNLLSCLEDVNAMGIVEFESLQNGRSFQVLLA